MKDGIKLLLSPWSQELYDQIKSVKKELIVISPWIKSSGIQLIKDAIKDKGVSIELITRLSTRDFISGISDLEAYQDVLSSFEKVNIRCVSNLHAKVYIFDRSAMILTSGNLTIGGLKNNIEAGVYIYSPKEVSVFAEEILNQIVDAPCFDNDGFKDISKQINDQIDHLENIYAQTSEVVSVKQSVEADLLTFGKRIQPKVLIPESYKLQVSSKKESSKKLRGTLAVRNPKKQKVVISTDLDSVLKKKLPKLYKKIAALFGDEILVLDSEELKQIFMLPTVIEHAQFSNEVKKDLWFGRKVWELAVRKWCYTQLADEDLNIIRFNDICKSLYSKAEILLKKVNLQEDDLIYIKTSNSELTSYFSKLPFILFGRVYRKLGLEFFFESLEAIAKKEFSPDNLLKIDIEESKSFLQAITQEKFKVTPTYTVISSFGPDDSKIFEVKVSILDQDYGEGSGASIKEAESQAARMALKKHFSKEVEYRFGIYNKPNNSTVYIEGEQKRHIERVFGKYLGKGLDKDWNSFKALHRSTVTPEWCERNHLDSEYSTFDLYASIGKSVWDLLLAMELAENKDIPTTHLEPLHAGSQRLRGIQFAYLKLDQVYKLHKAEKDHLLKETRAAAINSLYGYLFIHKDIETCKVLFKSGLSKVVSEIVAESISLSEEEIRAPFSRVQEKATKLSLSIPVFEITQYREEDNKTLYGVNLVIGEEVYGYGEGFNMKRARYNASIQALEKF